MLVSTFLLAEAKVTDSSQCGAIGQIVVLVLSRDIVLSESYIRMHCVDKVHAKCVCYQPLFPL